MSKGLEALKYLKENKRRHWVDGDKSTECLDTIEKELKEHEQYKAIEDKLGIDLITLFKALKNGIWVKDLKNNVYKVSCHLCRVETGGGVDCSLGLAFQQNGNYKWRYLVLDTRRDSDIKDYGKTWALTKEELL